MDHYRTGSIEAVKLQEGNIREVAEWLLPAPDQCGYFWYGDGPARLRTPRGELVAALGSWIVCLGQSFVVLDAVDFEAAFSPAVMEEQLTPRTANRHEPAARSEV